MRQLRVEIDSKSKDYQDQVEEHQYVRSQYEQTCEIVARNAHVTVLIDGDSLMFSKELMSRGERGGLEAAQSIIDILEAFAAKHLPQLYATKDWAIHIKLCVDLRAFNDALFRYKIVEKLSTFENFLKGMLNSKLHFDILNTSMTQGLTTRKMIENYRHNVLNVHCHQLFFAATPNDDLNALLDEYPDIHIHERVTFWEAKNLSDQDKFDQELSTMEMHSLLEKIPTEFMVTQLPSMKMATPNILSRVQSNTSTATPNTKSSSSAGTPVLSWAAMTAQPFVPSAGEQRSRSSTPAPKSTPPPTKVTTSSVSRNRNGERVDTVDGSIPYQELQRIKKMKLCNVFYLQGKNSCDGSCNHSHTYPLKTYEKNTLKEVARMTPCHNRLECDDSGCIYGHRCPQSKPGKKDCYYKDECRFVGWGHGIDDKIVKTYKV